MVGGEPHFQGSCGNCSFNSGSNACSLRPGGDQEGLAPWVKAILAAQNPSHSLVRGTPAAVSEHLSPLKLAFINKGFQKRAGSAASPTPKRPREEDEDSPTPAQKKPKGTPKKDTAQKSTSKGDTTQKGTPKGDIAAKKGPVATPKSSKKGKDAAEEELLPPFKNKWYSSPLDDPDVQNLEEDPAAAIEAYRALSGTKDRLEYDQKILKQALVA